MFKPIIRGVLALIGVSAALLPSDSQACWLTHCFSCCKPKATTFYAAPAPACNVCPQQVSYVPQTSFRAVENCVPCTTYRPVTTCDPCTGCPQTAMQPVTTYMRRRVMVPYTTYRPVVTTVAAPATGAAYNSPYYTGTPAPAGCANCPGGATYPAPATTYGAPAYGAPAITPGTPLTTPPSLPSSGTPTPAVPGAVPPNGAQPPSTFQDNNNQPPNGAGTNPSSYQPIPDTQNLQYAPSYKGGYNGNGGSSSDAPRLLDPHDRTTARPLFRSASILPAIFQRQPQKQDSAVKPVSQSTSSPIDDGWRPMGGR